MSEIKRSVLIKLMSEKKKRKEYFLEAKKQLFDIFVNMKC